MAQMHTLVLNGQSYTVTDPTAARIDDTQTGEGAWSAQRIVQEIGSRERSVIERLCPNFSAKGGEVTCQPVEGSALQVVSHMTMTQAGSGTPSPNNIRPITGRTAVTLQHNDSAFTTDLGQTVYDGTFNWSTGELTLTSIGKTVEALTSMQTAGYGNVWLGDTYTLPTNYGTVLSAVSSHYNGILFDPKYPDETIYAANAGGLVIVDKTRFTSLEAANAYLAQQKAAGTPVQIWYKLRTPVIVQLTPRELLALSGENVLSGDTGDTEVSGKADPMSVLQDIFSRLDALEQKEE